MCIRDSKISRSCYEGCELIWKKLKNRYDVIFYTNPEDVKLVDDGERSVDKRFRDQIIDIFNMYLDRKDFEAEVVELKGSVEDRLKTIKSTLDKLNIAIKI